ncbi:hypothetical protein SESBI_39069 [Sesbania bispinosa]|nr:hypothetical protein SESBI_39069 [Sesbania bispinosa]
MAENNSFEETFGELNAFQELPNTNERIHEATDSGLAESSKGVVAKHLLSSFNQVAADMKSEDDGYFHDMGSKKKNMKMQMQSTQTPLQRTTGNSFLKNENDMFYNRDSGVDLKVIASNFRRGHNLSAPNHTQESQVEDKSTLVMPRKLSFSPPGAFKKQKVSNLEPAKKCTPRRTPTSKNVITVVQQNKNVAKTYIKTKFKPSVDMKLTPAEVHLSLYTFQVQGDPSECLVRIGTSFATRGTLESLCPDKSVNREIIRLLARKISYDQRHLPSLETTWCLPPSFVWDIYRGSDVDKLLDVYTEEWMPSSRNLKYCKVISEMVQCIPDPASYYSPYYGMELWDISQPQQLPTSTNGMRIALDLVQGAHNQTLIEVLGKAEAFWQHIKNSNQQ